MTTQAGSDRLYDLLPALYRISDEDQGSGLRALMAKINEQADALHADIAALWDDFFIETCQRWVAPYVGDLVGNIALHDLDGRAAAATAESLFTDLRGPNLAPPNTIRTRADVANTISYRRRKGTPEMLEELAAAVTGFDARVVEFFTRLTWTQHLEHLRADCHGCPDLRSVDACDRIGGPWDSATHTVDVRAINQHNGWYGIPNIGFFLWRLKAQPHNDIAPRGIGSGGWRYTFSRLGDDTAIFAGADPAFSGAPRRTEPTVAAPIRPAAFDNDLAAHAADASTDYYGKGAGDKIVVTLDGNPVSPSELQCANLDDWSTQFQPTGDKFRIDVARGRLAIPTGKSGTVRVSYCKGFAANLGGGQYSRDKWLVGAAPTVRVSGGGTALQTALDAAETVAAPIVQIEDNLTYHLEPTLKLAAGQHLVIQAADETNPHLIVTGGQLSVTGGVDCSLTVSGLLIEGGLRIDADLRLLRILHCTLVPGRSVLQESPSRPKGSSLIVTAAGPDGAAINTNLEVQIAFSITGAMRMPDHITRLWLLDSIVDGVDTNTGPKGTAISNSGLSGPPAHIERCTVFGVTQFHDLELASESIFTGPVIVARRQTGCVRFSYVPYGSETPRRYRCQPDPPEPPLPTMSSCPLVITDLHVGEAINGYLI
jgi:hypothetical protein